LYISRFEDESFSRITDPVRCVKLKLLFVARPRNTVLRQLIDWQFEQIQVLDVRQLVSKHEEARGLLADSPATRPVIGARKSSTSTKSSSERRPRLSRMTAVDVDDSESQTSSSCPTSSSSSSTSTTPPGHPTPNVHQHQYTTIPPQVSAAVGGRSSQFQVPVRPVTAVCRVRPLTNVDWRGDGQRKAGTLTSSPEAAFMSPASALRGKSSDGRPVRRELGRESVITVTPLTSRSGLGPQSNSILYPYDDDDDDCDGTDGTLMSEHNNVVESKATVYDNVLQLHV